MLSTRFPVALALACLLVASAAAGDDPPALVLPGETLERELAPGEEHAFHVAPGSETPLRLVLEQHGVDVEIEVATETEAFVADGPFDRRFAESVLLERDGFVLRGREVGAPAGRYVLRLETLQNDVRLEAARAETEAAKLYPKGTADAWRRAVEHHRRAESAWREAGDDAGAARHLYARAVLHRLADETRAALDAAEAARGAFRRLADTEAEAYAHNELGLDHWRLGDLREARASFHRTASLADVYADQYLRAAASANLCLMHLSRGQILEGRTCYEDALPTIEAAASPAFEGAAHTNLGRIAEHLGEPEVALGHYERALAVHERGGEAMGIAQTLHNMGVLLRGLGELERSMERYAEALETFEALGRERWQARTLGNIGYAYLSAGDPRRAVVACERARTLFRQVSDSRGEANTLDNLGLARREEGELRQALELHQEALELRRATEHRRGEAVTLRRLGRVSRELGQGRAALRHLAESVRIATELGDRESEAESRRELGVSYLDRGELSLAREELRRARELSTQSRLEQTKAQVLYDLARTEERAGRSEAALELAEAAIDGFDGLRRRIAGPRLRTTFAELAAKARELEIRLLMAAHRTEPSAGHDRRALAAAERGRARTFLELLQEAGLDLTQGVDPELLRRREEVRRRLDAKSRRLVDSGLGAELRTSMESERLDLQQRLDVLDAEIRRASPSFAAVVRPRQLDAGDMQELLDPGTGLAVYSLGDEASYLWHVTSSRVRSYELPPRGEIQAAAREVHRMWSRRGGEAEDFTTAVELARFLRVDELVGSERLVVLADGALHVLPFAALPLPDALSDGSPKRLGSLTTVTYLPSASALAFDRRRRSGSANKLRSVAILADPEFGPGVARLPGSRAEAQIVTQAVDESARVFVALGPDADPDLAKSRRLGDFDVVHFATHGVIDTENPSLSRLLLSPEKGETAGYLHLQDVYDLRLDAEIVVLSGCRTALGPVVRGEGLVSLVRGFLHAGSRRVIASLWPVDDRAAAILMESFYSELWAGQPAASALAEAQRTLQRIRRHRDPHEWAAFVLVGDWR